MPRLHSPASSLRRGKNEVDNASAQPSDHSTFRGKPVRVYHFLPAEFALDDIKKGRIRISEIDQLNDPFELWCVDQSNRQLRTVLHGFKQGVGTKVGIVCFTRRWHNPLLWSHYADKHRGICLGFDVDERGLKPVKYVRRRPELLIPPTEESVNELLFTKYRDWKYEEEWRNWFKLDTREQGHYFYYFEPDKFVQLREIIAGPLCQITKAEIENAMCSYTDQINIVKARLAFRTFRVVKNRKAFQR
jgi:hypothetical protein